MDYNPTTGVVTAKNDADTFTFTTAGDYNNIAVVFRAGQLALMLGEGLLTAEDQRWLAPMFDRKQKAPIRLTFTRKTRGRPGAFPGVADDPRWGPILRELDVDELVRDLVDAVDGLEVSTQYIVSGVD